MSQPLDLSQFPDLPPEVVKAFEAAQFELSVERAARLHEQAMVAEKEAFIAELKELIEKLEGQVQHYRRAKFGPKSEKLDPAQLNWRLRISKPPSPRRRRRSLPSRKGSRPARPLRRRRPARPARRGRCRKTCRGSNA